MLWSFDVACRDISEPMRTLGDGSMALRQRYSLLFLAAEGIKHRSFPRQRDLDNIDRRKVGAWRNSCSCSRVAGT